MQVNFNRDEYDLLRQLADRYNTTPAWLAHDWIMERIGIELLAIKEARTKMGSREGRGLIPSPPEIPPDRSTE